MVFVSGGGFYAFYIKKTLGLTHFLVFLKNLGNLDELYVVVLVL